MQIYINFCVHDYLNILVIVLFFYFELEAILTFFLNHVIYIISQHSISNYERQYVHLRKPNFCHHCYHKATFILQTNISNLMSNIYLSSLLFSLL
jgi:hypothetical protein